MRIEEIEKTTYQGEQWPRDAREAAGPIPEELWGKTMAYTEYVEQWVLTHIYVS